MDYDHYIKKLKEHEAARTSTNDRNTYWALYNSRQEDDKKNIKPVPPTKARFEHG